MSASTTLSRRALLRGLALGIVGVATTSILGSSATRAATVKPYWVRTQRTTTLFSGPDDSAVIFGEVPPGSFFQVQAGATSGRLLVRDPRNDGLAWLEARDVYATAVPPPAGGMRLPPVTPPVKGFGWVSNFDPTSLYAGPAGDAAVLAPLPQFRRLLLLEPQQGDRLHVWDPVTDLEGFVEAAVCGPSGPSVWTTMARPPVLEPASGPARAVGAEVGSYLLPLVDDELWGRALPHNTPLAIRAHLVDDHGQEWYQLDSGEYVPGEHVRLPTPPERVRPGRWIDADLTEPTIVTAYEGSTPVYAALAVRGVAAWRTPLGDFRIIRRVANETMDSATIGIPRHAQGGYYLTDVLFTQYFTPDGASIHYNYWRANFGYAGSHGCLGMNYDDSKWFWDWASLGTPITIRG